MSFTGIIAFFKVTFKNQILISRALQGLSHPCEILQEFLNFLKMFYNQQKKKKLGRNVEYRTAVVVDTVSDEKDSVGARGSGPLNQWFGGLYS